VFDAVAFCIHTSENSDEPQSGCDTGLAEPMHMCLCP
jgi:hypothetical protein